MSIRTIQTKVNIECNSVGLTRARPIMSNVCPILSNVRPQHKVMHMVHVLLLVISGHLLDISDYCGCSKAVFKIKFPVLADCLCWYSHSLLAALLTALRNSPEESSDVSVLVHSSLVPVSLLSDFYL